METFTVTIERNEEQAQLLRDTAAFFKVSVPEFLATALTRGIAQAMIEKERLELKGSADEDIPF